jgi:signal transduction histidine kinase
LGGLVGDVLQIIRRLLPATIRIECMVPTERLEVMGDAAQIEQVMMNLCINARDAMANGGLITMHIARAELELSGRPPMPSVRLRVADNGPGVPAYLRARIFEPFFTTKPAHLGTGLGLAMAQSVMNAHGGRLHLDESQEQGAAFVMELPLA